MNNIQLVRKCLNIIYNDVVETQARKLIYDGRSANFSDNVILVLYPKRSVIAHRGQAVLEIDDDKITFLNNEDKGTVVKPNATEEELFQQSLVEETLGLFEIEQITKICAIIKGINYGN